MQVYQAVDGKIYAVIEKEDGSGTAFLSDITGHCQVVPFSDLFDHDGFYVEYYALGVGNVYDFFYFSSGDVPVRLVQCLSKTPAAILTMDLNGDGQAELLCGGQLYFQRDGEVYETGLEDLLLNACPELADVDGAAWDCYGRNFTVNGTDPDDEQWTRHLYFDGENILVYN